MFEFDEKMFCHPHPDHGHFPPEKKRYTMTEEMEHTNREMRECIARLYDFEKRLGEKVEDIIKNITSDNVIFKNTYSESHRTFLEAVKNEINTFEGNTDSAIALFMDEIKSDYATLSEDCAAQIQEYYQNFVDNLATYKAELNETYDTFRDAIESRIEMHNSNYIQSFNDYTATINSKIAEIERKLTADYTAFTTSVNNSVTEFENGWTQQIDARLDGQDAKINEATSYMYMNLNASVESLLYDMRERGAISGVISSEVFVTPHMYGAVGNGEENDVWAFQTAIDVLSERGGGVLLIPHGNYNLTGGNINVKSNIEIVGVGYPRLFTSCVNGESYFSIFKNDVNTSLENVKISGLFIDQWNEVGSGIQPDNNTNPFCAIAFLGECKNIDIRDNIIHGVGGWAIAVSDDASKYGCENVHISNNVIKWKQAGNGTWYDASAIYVESNGHLIENNSVTAVKPTDYVGKKWKIEGGIETHGIGDVYGNTIENAVSGINVVGFAYNTTITKTTKREIHSNKLNGVSRGIYFWMPKAPHSLDNISVYNNDIHVKAENEYTAYAGICLTMDEHEYTGNAYNGNLKNIGIFGNNFDYSVLNYTGTTYMHALNAGAISLSCVGTVEDVVIHDNTIKNFPYPAVVTYQHDSDVSRHHKNVTVIHNLIEDCGYNMSNEYQNVAIYMCNVDGVVCRENTFKWVDHTTTNYLVGGSYTTNMVFEGNKTISENGFEVYETIALDNKATNYIDAKNLGYREVNGNPNGTITPFKPLEFALDVATNTLYVSAGKTNTWVAV